MLHPTKGPFVPASTHWNRDSTLDRTVFSISLRLLANDQDYRGKTYSVIEISSTNNPSMVIDEQGSARLVRYDRTRACCDKYVYVHGKVLKFENPFSQPKHVLLRAYEEALAEQKLAK